MHPGFLATFFNNLLSHANVQHFIIPDNRPLNYFDLPHPLRYSLAMYRLLFLVLFMILIARPMAFSANSSSNFGGVGIDGVPASGGEIVVRQIVAGGPAHLAGIRVGDTITHVDSKPTRGANFQQIVNYRLRGRAGTSVLLTVHRPGRDKPLSFKLVRRQLLIAK